MRLKIQCGRINQSTVRLHFLAENIPAGGMKSLSRDL